MAQRAKKDTGPEASRHVEKAGGFCESVDGEVGLMMRKVFTASSNVLGIHLREVEEFAYF